MATAAFALSALTNGGLGGEADAGIASDGAGGWAIVAFLLILLWAPGLLLLWTKVFTPLIDKASTDRPQSPWSMPPPKREYATGDVPSWLPPEVELDDGTRSSDCADTGDSD